MLRWRPQLQAGRFYTLDSLQEILYSNPMKLSIIIPAKNEEELLPRLLRSIRSQTFTSYEVIVADANSTDRTREIAKDMGAKVVEGGLPGPARNNGAKHAQGEYLLFVDADALLKNNRFLEDTMKEMDAHAIDVATCRLKPISSSSIDLFLHGFYNKYMALTAGLRPHAPGSCIFVKRAVHEALGGFDETVVFAEDMEYVQRAYREGYHFAVLRSHPIYVSVRRLDQDGRFNIAMKYMFGELYMLTKGPFRSLPFEYQFDHFEKKKEKAHDERG